MCSIMAVALAECPADVNMSWICRDRGVGIVGERKAKDEGWAGCHETTVSQNSGRSEPMVSKDCDAGKQSAVQAD